MAGKRQEFMLFLRKTVFEYRPFIIYNFFLQVNQNPFAIVYRRAYL